MASTSGFGNIARALGNGTFASYAAGNAASLIGMWVQRLGVGWLTWQLTESGAWLGAMAFANMFPLVVFAPVAGALSDRLSPVRMIRVSTVLAAAQAAGLFIMTAGGWITVEWLTVLVALGGFFSALNQPARLALVPLLVPKENLPAAIAIGSLSYNSAQFIGPALAGVLITTGDVSATFAVNAVAFLLFLLAMARVRLHAAQDDAARRKGGVLANLAEGLNYGLRHKGIAPVLLLMSATAFGCRPVIDLFPGFAEAVFRTGPEGLAMLTAAVGLGSVAGAIWVAGRTGGGGLVFLLLVAVAVAVVSTMAFAATDMMWIALPAVAIAGAAMTPAAVSTQTLIQSSVDPAMRGRVMSLYVVLFRATPAIGALLMGAASAYLGLRWPVVGGVAVTFAALAWMFARRHRVVAALEGDGRP